MADDRGGLTDHAVADLPSLHVAAGLDDSATELVAEHDGIVDRPRMIGGPLMEIAATDADVGHFQQDVIRADRRLLDLADLDGALLRGEVDDSSGFHAGDITFCS